LRGLEDFTRLDLVERTSWHERLEVETEAGKSNHQ
jgi:hypothetical protein